MYRSGPPTPTNQAPPMSKSNASVEIAFRIPGAWSHAGELLERMPEGFRLTPEALVMPDETSVEFVPMRPDDQFAQIFRSSCRQPASKEELAIVDRYTVNVGLTCEGGAGGVKPYGRRSSQTHALRRFPELSRSITSLPDLKPPPFVRGELTSLRSFAPHTLG